MKFSDLLSFPHDDAGNIDMFSLCQALPGTPAAVLRHVYSAHGRKTEFQEQYGNLDLGQVAWEQKEVAAEDIIDSSVYSDFSPWLESVAERVKDFDQRGWSCVDNRAAVRESWRRTETWIEPPFLLVGALVGSESKLHLVEGHTRVGLLKGLVEHGYIAARSTHRVWVGTNAAA